MEISKYEIGKGREILCLPPRAVNDGRKRRRNPPGCRCLTRVAPFSVTPGTDMSPTAMTPCTDVSPTAYTSAIKDIGAIIMRVLHRIVLYEYR